MTEHLFPDNTVLCNFAAVNRLDLLKSVLGGRGRWTEAVAYEASRSAAKLPPLLTLPAEGWLDEPVEITKASDIRRFQHITTRETIDMMCISVADGDISAGDAFDLMNQMADSDRYLRRPKSAEELTAPGRACPGRPGASPLAASGLASR
ncbi:MAG: hypothetical protein ACRDNW_10360 [Trebonia sp.]